MTNKIEVGRCPKCNSENITYGTMELIDDGVFYPCTCEDCKHDFEEHYSLQFIGHVSDGEFLSK